jgi:hypothetical protein
MLQLTADITKYMFMWLVWGERDAYRVLVGKLETDSLEHLDIDGRAILKCIFKK